MIARDVRGRRKAESATKSSINNQFFGKPPPDAEPGVRTIEIPCRIESIAVLPLANVSGDPAQEYFADGITEALITELAKIRSLRVVSRTSVMRYRGTNEPIAQIARALRAQALLEGSVIMCGDRFRITVQLIHAGADQHLWAQTYEGAASDILDVQARVARDVAARPYFKRAT